MPTLHLTPAEQAIFDRLPDEIRDGARVEPETITFVDSDAHRDSRMRHLHLETPVLKEYQDQAATLRFTAEQLIEQAQKLDLSSISKKDVMELAFAWGPDVFTALIGEALPSVKTVQELQEIADLTDLRHGLLLSFTRTSSTPSV